MEHEIKDIKKNLIFLDMMGNESIDTYKDMLNTIDNIIDISIVRMICNISIQDMSDEDLKLLMIFAIITFEENTNIFIFPYKYKESVYQQHHYLYLNPVNKIISVKYNNKLLSREEYEISISPKYYIKLKNINKYYIPNKSDEKKKLEVIYTLGYYTGKKNSVPDAIINSILDIISDIYSKNEWKELSIEQYKVTA